MKEKTKDNLIIIGTILIVIVVFSFVFRYIIITINETTARCKNLELKLLFDRFDKKLDVKCDALMNGCCKCDYYEKFDGFEKLIEGEMFCKVNE